MANAFRAPSRLCASQTCLASSSKPRDDELSGSFIVFRPPSSSSDVITSTLFTTASQSSSSMACRVVPSDNESRIPPSPS
eukprot:CAMPEP_0201611362 /NCGR_PEP_ID=MMETSP0492-20130828/19885_1 /ASSEMBLY_ACC=CAM_ASM_000837 /TAXON_ID=420259 /ORGANISM="Thalassiosira gravida, Strain GMp14c1" /LENGTH=79 /DNA_ID=CAMNT_0048077515 /DNA_START=746 /DNA_END=982 /DNA_ORIENTATION=+